MNLARRSLSTTLHQVVSMPPNPAGKNPIVILHGLFGSSRNWNTLSRTLAHQTGRTCLALDLRNHGQSPHHLPMSWEAMQQDLETVCLQQPGRSLVLLGHSLGGLVVMQAMAGSALLRQLVSAMILVDIAPRALNWPGSRLQRLLHTLMEIERAGYGSRREAEEHLRAVEPSEQIVQFLLSNLRRTEEEKVRIGLPLEALDVGMTHLSATTLLPPPPPQAISDKPALFVRGDRSDYLQVERDWPHIQALFPASQLATIPGAGHWLHFERPVEFVEQVTRFLANLQ